MKFRWTMKELAEVSNHKFIETLITERKSTVDMGSPLDRKLVEVRAWHDKQEEVKADLLAACKAIKSALYNPNPDANDQMDAAESLIDQAIAKAKAV